MLKINKGQQGFTLIEIMIAVVVIAIMAAIAFPSYSEQVRKSRRADAKSTLLDIANKEQRYMLDNRSYGSLNDLGLGGTTVPSEEGYYIISITPASPTTSFTLTATATGSQVDDTDCSTFTVDQKGTKSGTSSQCWN